jgi:hypothetical protein
MLLLLRYSDHSLDNQRELRRWYSDNGLLFSELADLALVDSAAETVTVNKKVPMAGQEDHDFPEFVTDADDEPVTVDVICLTAMPLTWMLTMTGAWNEEQAGAATSASAFR